MQAAGKLLKSPDMLIYEVAEKTGYSNGGYFEKLLKNTGASPRKNIKKKNVRSFYHATNQRAYETILRHVQHALRLLLLL